jgi:hypothetical protein
LPSPRTEALRRHLIEDHEIIGFHALSKRSGDLIQPDETINLTAANTVGDRLVKTDICSAVKSDTGRLFVAVPLFQFSEAELKVTSLNDRFSYGVNSIMLADDKDGVFR